MKRVWLMCLLLAGVVGCEEEADNGTGGGTDSPDAATDDGPDMTDAASGDASSPGDDSTGMGDAAADDGDPMDPPMMGDASMDAADPDNPCSGMDPVAGEAFTLDFGSEGTFSFDGTTHACQMIGIHSGTWESADGTSLAFTASSMSPFSATAVGSELTVTSLVWQRTAREIGAQSDQFDTTTAKIRVVKGGPFEATNLGAPVTVCIYDVEDFTHPNMPGVSAQFPGPVALACNDE